MEMLATAMHADAAAQYNAMAFAAVQRRLAALHPPLQHNQLHVQQ